MKSVINALCGQNEEFLNYGTWYIKLPLSFKELNVILQFFREGNITCVVCMDMQKEGVICSQNNQSTGQQLEKLGGGTKTCRFEAFRQYKEKKCRGLNNRYSGLIQVLVYFVSPYTNIIYNCLKTGTAYSFHIFPSQLFIYHADFYTLFWLLKVLLNIDRNNE